LLIEIRIAIQGVDLHCFPVHVYMCNLPSKLVLPEITFSLVPGTLVLLASVALKFLH
jgi:hypothetical protein